MRDHFILPDAQVKDGVKTNHLFAAGRYCLAKRPKVIVCLGDFFDMPSLSSYDKGTKRAEGKTYQKDINAGIKAMKEFLKPINDFNKRQRKSKHKTYNPRMVFLLGNHEYRIVRHVNAHPELHGKLGYQDLKLEEMGWEVYDFLQPVEIDGLTYSHYFYQPMSGKAYGGKATTKLNNIGFSFVMGHQQGLDMAMKHLANGRTIRALVVGSYYQHFEDYKGYQANDHWQGCIHLSEVANGDYCLLELSLNFLLRKYGNKGGGK